MEHIEKKSKLTVVDGEQLLIKKVSTTECNPSNENNHKTAEILNEIFSEITNYKDTTGQYITTKTSPPKKNLCPEYYEIIDKPIDMATIELDVSKGDYKLPGSFDEGVIRMLSDDIEFFALSSNDGSSAQELLDFYTSEKQSVYQRLESIIGDSELIKTFILDKNEKIIRCICNIFRDDDKNVQCCKCMVWQHIECTGAHINAGNYLCERCDERVADLEIPLEEYTDAVRGELRACQTEKPFICDYCYKAFGTKRSVNAHRRRTHMGEKSFSCKYPECSFKFSTESAIIRHTLTHTDENPFTCKYPECSRKFKCIAHLVVHNRIHTGDKPYECHFPKCGRVFIQKCNLVAHNNIHKGEIPFACTCPKCDKVFNDKRSLQYHIRYVHQFTCNYPECKRARFEP